MAGFPLYSITKEKGCHVKNLIFDLGVGIRVRMVWISMVWIRFNMDEDDMEWMAVAWMMIWRKMLGIRMWMV